MARPRRAAAAKPAEAAAEPSPAEQPVSSAAAAPPTDSATPSGDAIEGDAADWAADDAPAVPSRRRAGLVLHRGDRRSRFQSTTVED